MIDTVGEGLRIFSGDFPVIQDSSAPRKAVAAPDNQTSPITSFHPWCNLAAMSFWEAHHIIFLNGLQDPYHQITGFYSSKSNGILPYILRL